MLKNKLETGVKNSEIHFRISQVDKEIITKNAKECDMSMGEFLRTLGVGYTPKNHEHLKKINDLIVINGDLGRLGGLLKFWLSGQRPTYGKDLDIFYLLQRIELTRKELEDVMDVILKL